MVWVELEAQGFSSSSKWSERGKMVLLHRTISQTHEIVGNSKREEGNGAGCLLSSLLIYQNVLAGLKKISHIKDQ